MKLLKAEVENFGSYKHLSFDYSNAGLALVFGATGSGKSTLLDIPNWILFGTTAKGMAADDVRSWNTEGKTEGTLHMEHQGRLQVVRVRGPQQNDLYWIEDGQTHRGKDLNETQKLLSNRLALDADSFSQSSYYHEFSSTGSFFTAKAKDRREQLEGLCDLRFAESLSEGIKESTRACKKLRDLLAGNLSGASGKLEAIQSARLSCAESYDRWENEKDQKRQNLIKKAEGFEQEKEEKIKALEREAKAFEAGLNKRRRELEEALALAEKPNKCPQCGNAKGDPMFKSYQSQLRQLDQTNNPYIDQIKTTAGIKNVYAEQLHAVEANPFESDLNKLSFQATRLIAEVKELETKLSEAKHRLFSLDQLYDLSFELRGLLLAHAVAQIQNKTNALLEKFFDSELRVRFKIEGGDDLEVGITKNGNEATFKQLSKGQRALLKLCFAVSVMEAAANKVGQHFDTLLFDEALDGLDAELKVKAFCLFEDLSIRHASVILVDHMTEFKSLFNRKYEVKMSSDQSEIEETL